MGAEGSISIAGIPVLGIRDSASRALAAGIYRTLRFRKVARDLDPVVLGEVARLVSNAADLDIMAMDREILAMGASVMEDSSISITAGGMAVDFTVAGTGADGTGAATTCGSWEICSAWRWISEVWR